MAAVKTQAEVVTKHQSLQIMKHTLNLGVSSILYLRNCFEEEAFQALKFEGLHLRQLKPVNREARQILSWLQKAVYEALQMEYLESLSLGIHERHSDKMLECYQFHFTYAPDDAGVAVSVRKGQNLKTIGARICVSKEEAKRQTEVLVYNEQAPDDYCPDGFRMGDSLTAFGSDVPLDALTGEIKTGHHGLTVRIQTLCDSEETYFYEAANAKQKEHCLKQHIKAFIIHTGNTDIAMLSHLLGVPPLMVSTVLEELRRQGMCLVIKGNKSITLEARALIGACESLPKRFKYVNKYIVASACAVTEHVAKELLKHLIQRGLVKSKTTRGKGHESNVYVPAAATRSCSDSKNTQKRERKRPGDSKQSTSVHPCPKK